MGKAYQINEIKFEDDCLILMIDSQVFRFKLSDISDKLAAASEFEKKTFKVSPAGYGIHWPLIDEDLSITGLIDLFNSTSLFNKAG